MIQRKNYGIAASTCAHSIHNATFAEHRAHMEKHMQVPVLGLALLKQVQLFGAADGLLHNRIQAPHYTHILTIEWFSQFATRKNLRRSSRRDKTTFVPNKTKPTHAVKWIWKLEMAQEATKKVSLTRFNRRSAFDWDEMHMCWMHICMHMEGDAPAGAFFWQTFAFIFFVSIE